MSPLEPPAEAQNLAERRAAARADKDFATADRLRDRLAELGWRVTDSPGGWALEPVAPAGLVGRAWDTLRLWAR